MTRAVRRGFGLPALLALPVVFMAGAPGAAAAAVQEEKEPPSRSEMLERLRPEHRDWLEKEVVYIITERERDVFLTLETFEERNRFIEIFWEKRDPHPATPENEFRDEHYKRFEYANKFLGRETFREGWRTDRGRYYIVLGEPRERHSFDGYNEVVSTELWFYQGDIEKSLPPFFYLVFFKRHDIGEYVVYHPIVDGPQALVRGQYGVAGGGGLDDNVGAYEALQRIDAELANASLSLDPSEPGDWFSGRASLGSDLVLARIADSPRRAIRTDYADAWLRYRDRVSSEYSFNFVPSRGVFAVTAGPDATPFLNFSIEIDPQNFTLETDEDQTEFYTTLDITIDVTEASDESRTAVLGVERPAFLELTRSQVDQVRASPFAYQDSIPLVPGAYEVSIILRNRAAQQFTVLETELDLTRFESVGSGPMLADVIAGFEASELEADPGPAGIRTFQVGNVSLKPAADGLFALGDTLHAFTQVLGAGEEARRVRFEIRADSAGEPADEVLAESVVPVAAGGAGAALARVPLALGVGGNYWLAAVLESEDGAVLDRRSRLIQVSPRAGVPRSGFVYRRGFNASAPGLLALVRGDQFLAKRQFDRALAEYERAVAAGNEELPAARWKLAHGYLQNQRVAEAAALLEPMEEAFPDVHEVAVGLGFVRYFQNRMDEAVAHLEHARSLRTADTNLLNVLGDAYARLGRTEDARAAMERSLEMNPEQPDVREMLDRLGPASQQPRPHH